MPPVCIGGKQGSPAVEPYLCTLPVIFLNMCFQEYCMLSSFTSTCVQVYASQTALDLPADIFCSDTLYVHTDPDGLPSFAEECSFGN